MFSVQSITSTGQVYNCQDDFIQNQNGFRDSESINMLQRHGFIQNLHELFWDQKPINYIKISDICEYLNTMKQYDMNYKEQSEAFKILINMLVHGNLALAELTTDSVEKDRLMWKSIFGLTFAQNQFN